MAINSDFRLSVDGLVIRASTQEEVESLGHPLDRPRPAAHELSRFNYLVVVRQQDEAIVSSLVIERVRADPGTISMDWATDKAEQRKGYASKAAGALVEWLYRQPGVRRIEIDIVPGGEARDRTAHRVGFRRTARPGRWAWRPD
jgi:RimJ/RimL family protein N-acetyltransferase